MPKAHASNTPNIHEKYHMMSQAPYHLNRVGNAFDLRGYGVKRLIDRMGIGPDVFFRRLSPQYPVDPTGIGHDERQEHDNRPEHQHEGAMAGGGVKNRQAAVRLGAGRHDKREHGKSGGQNDTGQSRSAADESQSRPMGPGHRTA